jgi:16S rRNA processing protein RimM
MSDLILLGYIAKAFGIKGAVFIKLINTDSEALLLDQKIIIKQANSDFRELTITQVLGNHRVFFAEITDRNEAEKLQGAEVFIKRDDLPELPEDEYYLTDLINSKVVLKTGELVGELIGFSSNNAQILLEIKTLSGHVASVPLVPAIVIDIDEEKKIITLDPPSGLLEPLD